MIQRDLFGNEIKNAVQFAEIMQIVNWSYSKMQAFKDCPRKFYFLYYGRNKKTAKAEALKKRLIELGQLSNKYLVQGNIIHRLISTYFKKAKQGDIWDIARLTSFADMMINEIIAHTLNVKDGRTKADEKYPKPIIKELFYSSDSGSDLKIEMLDVIAKCLKNFFSAEEFKPLLIGGTQSSSIIESATTFSFNETVKVDGKVDLAYLDEDRLVITDWKTGQKEIEDTSLQLLVYALWARQLEELEFKEVEIQKAYLAEGNLEKLEFSELHVERAGTRIMQDAEILNEMSEFGKGAVKEAFATHVGKNCRICPFEEICNKNL